MIIYIYNLWLPAIILRLHCCIEIERKALKIDSKDIQCYKFIDCTFRRVFSCILSSCVKIVHVFWSNNGQNDPDKSVYILLPFR